MKYKTVKRTLRHTGVRFTGWGGNYLSSSFSAAIASGNRMLFSR